MVLSVVDEMDYVQPKEVSNYLQDQTGEEMDYVPCNACPATPATAQPVVHIQGLDPPAPVNTQPVDDSIETAK